MEISAVPCSRSLHSVQNSGSQAEPCHISCIIQLHSECICRGRVIVYLGIHENTGMSPATPMGTDLIKNLFLQVKTHHL